LAARGRIAAAYGERLGNRVGVPTAPPGYDSAWGLYTITLPGAAARERMRGALATAGVPSGIYYPRPLHGQPAYAAAHAAGFAGTPPPLPVSEALCDQALSLPMHPYLKEAEVDRVCAAVSTGL